MIDRNLIDSMFADIRRYGWDANGELVWGYFFTNETEKPLEEAARELEASGYRFVDLSQDEETTSFWLHVEKVEHHTPDSLAERNEELASFAKRHGLQSYDGMDAGPVTAE